MPPWPKRPRPSSTLLGVGGCSVIHWNRVGVGCCSQSASFPERPPAMVDATLPLPDLSPIDGKDIVARFDGGRLSSDGGLVVLREIERRLSVADRLAACIDDPRDPASTVHTLADIIRFRLLMIAAGYEDANDATGLRFDPLFKMALERLPSERDLCSQSTISRLENLPDARTLLRLGRALVDLYCASFRQVPRRITLDIDDTFDAVHGGQQLRLFNAHYDDYGFQPIVVFDQDGRFVTAVLRPAKRPKGVEIRAFLRRLVGAIRATWPQVEILLRADSHYACPEVLDWCEANGLDYILGLAPTSTLKRHVAAWRRAPRPASRPIRPPARSAASRNSMTPPAAGAGSAVSSPASRPAATAPRPASSSPTSGTATADRCTRTSTAGADRRKTTSKPGNRTSPPTGPHVPRPPPISSACSCTPAPTGCCGACAR